MKKELKYSVNITCEEVSMPPFRDILILAKKCPHGIQGVSQCLKFLSPDAFEYLELKDEHVEAVLISKAILKRLPAAKVIEILKENVFPYINTGEIVKVDFKIIMSWSGIEGKLSE